MDKELIATWKRFRITKRITLRDVEKATGISNAYLSQLETGKIKNPSYDVIVKLTQYYNEIVDKGSCPCCGSSEIKDESVRHTNGVFGPGFASWSLLDFSVCQSCGVMFKKIKLNLNG